MTIITKKVKNWRRVQLLHRIRQPIYNFKCWIIVKTNQTLFSWVDLWGVDLIDVAVAAVVPSASAEGWVAAVGSVVAEESAAVVAEGSAVGDASVAETAEAPAVAEESKIVKKMFYVFKRHPYVL